MFKNISLSLAGLIFVIMIAIVYLKKKKYDNVDSNIYRILIFWTIFLLLLEISCSIFISYIDKIPLITEILCRFYIFGAASWFILLIAYMKSFLEPEKYKKTVDVFQDKSMLILLLISLILFIISCFSELTYTSQNIHNFNVIGGDAVFVLYAVFGCACVLIVKVLSRNTDRMTLIKRLPIILYLLLFTVMKIFQSVYSDLSDLGFLFSFCVVSMYFTIENQDIKLVSELEIARKNAEVADKNKTEFLSKMSHEIRTPMNAIIGFSENLMKKDDASEKETLEDVNNIYIASKKLLEIINNILLFSRIESKKEKIDNFEYEITDIMSELETFINSKIENSDIKYKININDNIPLNYIGDKAKIYRMLVNLVSNSIDNTNNGIIEINVSCVVNDDVGKLKFVVKDTGIGMREEEKLFLLEQFSNNEEKTNITSTGLGLLIVKKIIDMFNGNISIDSEYGLGSVVEVEFEQHIVGNKLVKDNKSLNLSVNNENYFFDCSDCKVLIVDDNNLNLKVLEKLLKFYNIKIESINDGNTCIERIKQGNKYDIIFLDHMMSDLDGIETLKILKKLDMGDLPPIIMMTANNQNDLISLYYKNGFSDYLSKPIDSKKLNKIMIKYLKKDS